MQQVVPTLEVVGRLDMWFVSVNKDGRIEEFSNKKEAFKAMNDKKNTILVDVIKNQVVKKSENYEDNNKCKAIAIEKGFFIDSCQEMGGIRDVIALFIKHFNVETDSLFFLMTLTFITLAHYIGGYSEILSGNRKQGQMFNYL